jgi:hypothetical protein
MIILGFVLSWKETTLRSQVHDAAIGTPSSGGPPPKAIAGGATPVNPSDYVKNLADLAKNLSGLTPAVSAFIISTILFFFAMSLGAVYYAVSK